MAARKSASPSAQTSLDADAPKADKKPAARKAPAKKTAKAQTLVQALTSFLEGPLVADLVARAAAAPAVDRALRTQWEQERAANRTAEHFEGFRQRIALQVGASWLLACVFVRTLEDRSLIERRRLAGEGADDSERLFFEQFPSLGHRDYLLAVFREVGKLPGAASVLGPGTAPAYRLGPSSDVARELLKLFRRTDDASGALLYRFDGDDTRVLGDIYQDLSADIRERYALLQTPNFVEEFILSRTLTPAIATFGLEEVRLIDPTCGSGHFLLGAFQQLVERWQAHAPALSAGEVARRALAQVHGVDLNPYAIAIARFRLTLAFLKAARLRRLRDVTEVLPLNLVVADSLLIAARKETRRFSEVSPEASWGDHLFTLEDPKTAYKLLGQGYHVVVGNPPYITAKDASLREEYRRLYDSAAGKFALAAPFTERFFQLGVPGGYVGLINANSFMKREFGKKLIEEVLPHYDLTHVLDTAGAFIPGHGTPTVILFGRTRQPTTDTVRAVLGKRGEPSTPDQPGKGHVWLSIAQHVDQVDFENEFVSVAEVERKTFSRHPWSLGGGGAAELKELLEGRAEGRLISKIVSIGFMSISGEDDVFLRMPGAWHRSGAEPEWIMQMSVGEDIRDWRLTQSLEVFFPYKRASLQAPNNYPSAERCLWPYRRTLLNRPDFGGKKYIDVGRPWFEFHQVPLDRLRTPFSIAFAEVATHNHFILDRGGTVFNRTAPIIKLPAGATEDDHLALLGYLNSSTMCFWMKQVMMSKGGSGIGRGVQDEAWEGRYQNDGTKLANAPLPNTGQTGKKAQQLERLAVQASQYAPATLLSKDSYAEITASLNTPGPLLAVNSSEAVAAGLRDKESAQTFLWECMIAQQEEVDWHVYDLFGLLTEEDRKELKSLPPLSEEEAMLKAGHRPFEIELWEKTRTGDDRTAWFERNRYATPDSLAEVGLSMKARLEARLRILRRNPLIGLIERPEYKRRWTLPDWEEEVKQAATQWLLGQVENEVKEATIPIAIQDMSSHLSSKSGVEAITSLLGPFLEIGPVLVPLVAKESVPYLAALRHTEAGMAKRREWEKTWALQRREDAGEKVDIPVPPKYDSKDFLKAEYFSLRGKLDVPKERFIGYPGAELAPGEVVVGWAGWNHLQRATALAGLYQDRKEQHGWEGERLVPLLAGLWELVPWLRQWHNEPDENYGGERLGDYFASFVAEEARLWGKTTADLEAWRPAGK